ncbi:MAG: BadF/BadG/BcrA/BcrD ATPase family protein [Aliidongia sp.]
MSGTESLFLGVDGGGSGCRVRLVDAQGLERGAGVAGATNIRLGLAEAWASILGATDQALAKAGLGRDALPQIHAGLGLAGITGPVDVERVRAAGPGFASIAVDTDAHTACLGAFAGQDGAIISIGTGSVGYAVIRGEPQSIGGWGFEVSDQGSGADIGREAVRAALLGHDGLGPATDFTASVMKRLGGHPPQVVAWANSAKPRDYAEFARDTLGFAQSGDPGRSGDPGARGRPCRRVHPPAARARRGQDLSDGRPWPGTRSVVAALGAGRAGQAARRRGRRCHPDGAAPWVRSPTTSTCSTAARCRPKMRCHSICSSRAICAD